MDDRLLCRGWLAVAVQAAPVAALRECLQHPLRQRRAVVSVTPVGPIRAVVTRAEYQEILSRARLMAIKSVYSVSNSAFMPNKRLLIAGVAPEGGLEPQAKLNFVRTIAVFILDQPHHEHPHGTVLVQ